MREFLSIHPFRDGNGRVARLVLSLMLRDVTLVPFTFSTLSRDKYLKALESRQHAAGEPARFCRFVIREAYVFVGNIHSQFADDVELRRSSELCNLDELVL
jgi:fido (protein-threonine AMPylation protein)